MSNIVDPAQTAPRSSLFLDPDQTAPIGAVCSGSTLFSSILNFVSNVRQLIAADDFSRRNFHMDFFLATGGHQRNYREIA